MSSDINCDDFLATLRKKVQQYDQKLDQDIIQTVSDMADNRSISKCDYTASYLHSLASCLKPNPNPRNQLTGVLDDILSSQENNFLNEIFEQPPGAKGQANKRSQKVARLAYTARNIIEEECNATPIQKQITLN